MLQTWVRAVTRLQNTDVRPRWQATAPNFPAPDHDWCAVGVLSDEPEPGTPHQEMTDAGLLLRRHRIVNALVTFYGPAAEEYAGRLSDGGYVEPNRGLLNEVGITLVTFEPMRHVPELFNSIWINRVDLPIRLRRAVERTYALTHVVSADGHVNSDLSYFEAK